MPAAPSTLSALLSAGFTEEVAVLDGGLRLVEANATFLAARAASLDAIRLHPCHEVLPGCASSCRESRAECPVHEAMETGGPVSLSVLDAQVGGETRHLRIDVYPVPASIGEPPRILHITRDITRRVEDERLRERMWTEILLHTDKLYASMLASHRDAGLASRETEFIVESMPLALVGWDRDGLVNRWNASAELLFGSSFPEARGKPFLQFFASGRSQESFARILADIRKGRPVAYSLCENRTASGRLTTCEWHHTAIHHAETRELLGGISLGQDISDKLSAQEELAQTAGQLQAVLNISRDAIVGVSHLGRIMVWNHAAEELFGWRDDEVRGREFERLIPSHRRHDFLKLVRESFDNEASPQEAIETLALRRDGRAFPSLVTLSRTVIGNRPVLLALFFDTSERKRLEKVMKESEKSRELGELCLGLTQEFRGRLATILAALQLLRQEEPGERHRDRLDLMEAAANAALAEIVRVERFASPTEEHEDRFEPLDLNTLLREAVELSRFKWQGECGHDTVHIQVETDLGDLPPVQVLRHGLQEALTGILFNAIEAVPPQGGQIRTSTRQEDDRAVILVSDNGRGIAAGDLPHVFEPFLTSKGPGHPGLGLTVARRLVERHGGEISLTSTPGVGTRVRIDLPLTQASRPVKAESPGRRILLAEDDELLRRALAQALAANGHEVSTTGDGTEAMRLFRQQPFDLVLAGQGLPGVNGMDLASRMKEAAPGVPFFLLAAGSAPAGRTTTLMAEGVDEVIPKPCPLTELLARIDAYPPTRP